MREDKLRRLERVARLYYEDGLNQEDIAAEIGVSRPFISRMLNEARDIGIVEIKVRSQVPIGTGTLEKAISMFKLGGGYLVPDGGDDPSTNRMLGNAALDLVQELGGGRLGLGWGHVIGELVASLERRKPARGRITDVSPLVGNRGVPIRHYHSNENVRIVAQQTKSTGHYLHTPALAETKRELELLQATEHYREIKKEWERLDIALVNVGNHPATPDFASVARYGNLLTQQRAIGRLIAYFFNAEGKIIHSDTDYAIQIPLPTLARCPNVIGICSANVSAPALHGALKTGILTHVVAREALMASVVL
ncbi:MAG: hypothetical protein LBR58_01095 [Propionibacteriaceae bacterium]|nr:hypothetical protein [Propionibacteriaceae bacterium]